MLPFRFILLRYCTPDVTFWWKHSFFFVFRNIFRFCLIRNRSLLLYDSVSLINTVLEKYFYFSLYMVKNGCLERRLGDYSMKKKWNYSGGIKSCVQFPFPLYSMALQESKAFCLFCLKEGRKATAEILRKMVSLGFTISEIKNNLSGKKKVLNLKIQNPVGLRAWNLCPQIRCMC